jgi:hypothetical protein
LERRAATGRHYMVGGGIVPLAAVVLLVHEGCEAKDRMLLGPGAEEIVTLNRLLPTPKRRLGRRPHLPGEVRAREKKGPDLSIRPKLSVWRGGSIRSRGLEP